MPSKLFRLAAGRRVGVFGGREDDSVDPEGNGRCRADSAMHVVQDAEAVRSDEEYGVRAHGLGELRVANLLGEG